MGSLPTLPPSLEAHIDQTVIHTYRQAFDAFSSLENLNSSADISRRTAKAILLRVHATIRSAQREQNGRLSLQNRLPPDVWCNVWQHLSFADRIAVTHVCSAWRATAVNAPALWNHIEFYTTRHCPHCWCTECEDPADYFEPGHAPEWEEGAYPKNATNITAADILLSRSRALDLSVTVFITPLEVREEDLTTLAHSLSGIHLNRLRSLVLYTADFTAPRLFLRGFPALPMLNCLSIQNLPVPSGQIELPGTPHHHTCVPENLPLPVLDSLRFASRFSLPADHSYLTVRSLALEPTRDAEWELFQAIEACPNVERLTLDLGVTAEEADSEYDASWWDGRKPTSLRAATIASVPASCESWIRGVFAPTLPSLALEYAHTRELNTGGGILCDLKSDIHLSVTQSDSALSVRGVDRGGAHTRSVSVCLKDSSPLEILVDIFAGGLKERWRHVSAVTADASLWPLLVSLFPATHDGMRIKTLCVIVNRRVRKPAPSRAGIQPPRLGQQRVAALRSLTLTCGPRAVIMAPGDIHVLVHGLQLTLPLATLEIDHRLCAGNPTEFRDLAEYVSVGVYSTME